MEYNVRYRGCELSVTPDPLDDAIGLYTKLRANASILCGSEYAEEFDPDFETLKELYAIFFNSSTQALEGLINYRSIWQERCSQGAFSDKSEKYATARIHGIQKWAFIETMSMLEFQLKKLIKQHDLFEDLSKLILSRLFDKINKYDTLSEVDYDGWRALIEFRNCIIHNNAISDKNITFIDYNFSLEMKEGEMIRVNLSLMPAIQHWMLEKAEGLFKAILKAGELQKGTHDPIHNQ